MKETRQGLTLLRVSCERYSKVTLKKCYIIKIYLNSTSVQSSSHKKYDFKIQLDSTESLSRIMKKKT